MKPQSETTYKKTRKRYTSAERRSLVSRYQKSGLSQAAFCRKNNIAAATFTKWPGQCAKQKSATVKFVEFELPTPVETGASLEVGYPDGRLLRLRDFAVTEESAAFIRRVISC
jgi:hypothetical protein